MAYKFFYPTNIVGETLFTKKNFKNKIDNIVAKSKHITFVGWRYDTGVELIELMKYNFQNITVIEIFKENANILKNFNLCKVICDDIQNFNLFLNENEMETLIWQDGPEHLLMQNSINILDEMKKYFSNIIISTPNGIYEQDEMYGNIYEKHLSFWNIEDYKKLNFNVSELDQKEFLIGYWSKLNE